MKNMIDILLQHPVIEAFGLAILHSLWQGALATFVLFVVLRFVRHSSNVRYILACGSLLFLLIVFVYTIYLSYTPAVQIMSSSVDEFTTSNHIVSEIFVLQSADFHTEKPFSFVTAFTAMSIWMGRHAHYIFALWLVGFLVFSSRLCLGLYYAEKLKRSGQQPEDKWKQRLEQLRHTLGIKSSVRLLISEQVHAPLTLEWLKPVILLPVGMLTQLPYEHLESILLHELAHIKRQDYLINLFQAVAETLLFFNPAYWYIARIIERERENACDDMAVGILQQPLNYARALTRVAELSGTDLLLSKTTVAANKGSLTERIRRIVLSSADQTIQRSEKTKWYLLSITLLAVLAAILFTQEVKGFQSETAVEKGIEPDPDVDLTVDKEVDLAIEEDADVNLGIDIDNSLELELDAQGAHLDSTSLYHFLYSQWEGIKKRKEAMGEEVPDNVLLSDKTLYIVDGEARDPKTIRPPFDYTVSIPHTVMWAAMMHFEFFDIEDSYTAFRKKFPGEYNTVIFLTSKALKAAVNPDEPFTVTGKVFDGKTKTPIAGAKVFIKETATGTVTDAEGNFSLLVPNADARLVFSHEEKGYPKDEWSVKWNRDRKMYVRLHSTNWLKKITPEVEVKAHDNNGNPQKRDVSFKETFNSSDTGTVTGKASAIVLEIDENRKDLPLYLVDGVEVSPAVIKKLDPHSLQEIEVIKKQTAVKRYGEKGKNGVVMVRTKKAMQEVRGQLPSLSNAEPPLIIIDGKQVNKQAFSLLKPGDIATIDVLKGKEATQKYGNKGVNGVVVVNTKSKKNNEARLDDTTPSDSRPPIFIIDGIRYTYQELSNFNTGSGKFIIVKSGNSEFQVNLDPDDIISMLVQSGQPGVTSSGKQPVDVVIIKTKSGTNQNPKETEKSVSLFNLSEDKVLYLLDGVKTNSQTIKSSNVGKIALIGLEDTTFYNQKLVEEYRQKYPGNYKYLVAVTSKNNNSNQVNNFFKETYAYDRQYFSTLKSFFDYYNDPSHRDFTIRVDYPLPNSYDGIKSSIMSVVDGAVQNKWVIKPHEVATVAVYQRNNAISYFYHVEKGYGHVSIDGKDKFEYLRKSYPGEYDELLIITTKKGKDSSNNLIEKSTASDHLKVFPNPSENIFTIRFTLEEATPVQVAVINPAGQPVTTLTDRSLKKGAHELTWDATDQKTGLYRIRIVQNGETTYRNVVVK